MTERFKDLSWEPLIRLDSEGFYSEKELEAPRSGSRSMDVCSLDFCIMVFIAANFISSGLKMLKAVRIEGFTALGY